MTAVVVSSNSLHEFNMPQVHQNDLEVEEILNEIGFYANDDFGDSFFGSGYADPTTLSAMTGGAPSSSFAPVSPHHRLPLQTQTPQEISPSSSVENLHTFSVPNPMAAMLLPVISYPIAPRAAAFQVAQAAQVQVQVSHVAPKKAVKKAVNKNRKRKLSPVNKMTIASLAPPRPVISDASSCDENGELTEEQLEERRQRNREHAKRSRQRKKSLTAVLQQSMDELKAENVKLRQDIYAVIGQEKAEDILESRRVQARDQFMQGIQDISSRALDDTTVGFLKALRKNLPSSASRAAKKQKTN